jgi:hypothetical protein
VPVLRTLSKSDFKVAQSCPTKLYYKKLHYPTTRDHDPYLTLLSDGGYMVEKLAKLLYPEGVALEYGAFDREAQAARTMELLASRDEVVLFEATLLSGAKLARVDILVKRGRVFELIEVKAKSWDGTLAEQRLADGHALPYRGKRGRISAEWQTYLEDVTYQCLVLSELVPGATIRPFLLMPDKSRTTSLDEMHRRFSIRRVPTANGAFEQVHVDFSGDPDDVRNDHFLTLVPVDDAVAELLPGVRASAERYLESLAPELTKIPTPISIDCNGCEYRAIDGDDRDGYLECWGALGRVEPHLFEMYSLSSIGGRNDPVANHLIASGKACLFDIDEGMLLPAHGPTGSTASRQLVQLTRTRENREWVSDAMTATLDALAYPLHFIDFETSRLAIPYHAHMRPYGLVAFQWSCLTIPGPGAAPVHAEWLNDSTAYPNFEFAESLRACLGEGGSVLTWARHEGSSLAEIAREIDVRGYEGAPLAAWLECLLAPGGRMVDLHDIARQHYYHPLMKGRTSIKWVLDAVWQIDPEVRSLFPEYGGDPECPYRTLPALEIGGRPARIAEGQEAMRAYQDMMYGQGRDDAATRARYRALLLQYCRLDTAAMIMIWDHWRRGARPAGARLSAPEAAVRPTAS